MAYHPHHLGLRGLGQSKPGVDNTGRDVAQVASTIGTALPGIVGLFTGQQTAPPATTPLVPMQPAAEQSGMPDWVVPAAVIGGGLVIIGVLAMVARKPKSVAANRRRRRKSSRTANVRRRSSRRLRANAVDLNDIPFANEPLEIYDLYRCNESLQLQGYLACVGSLSGQRHSVHDKNNPNVYVSPTSRSSHGMTGGYRYVMVHPNPEFFNASWTHHGIPVAIVAVGFNNEASWASVTPGSPTASRAMLGFFDVQPLSMQSNRRRRRKSSRLSRSRRSDGGLTPNYLSEAERKRIPLKAFVFPDRRAWPLDNPRRAYAAIQMLRIGRIGSAADFNKVRNAIRERYPEVYAIYGKGLSYEKSKSARSKAKASRAKTVAAKRRTSRKAAN